MLYATFSPNQRSILTPLFNHPKSVTGVTSRINVELSCFLPTVVEDDDIFMWDDALVHIVYIARPLL